MFLKNTHIPIISYLLDKKVTELKPKINKWLIEGITINAKVYHREKGIFNEVNQDLFNIKYFSIN